LASSLDQQLVRRKKGHETKTTQNCIAMGIFRRVENSHELMESIQCCQLKVDLEVSVNTLEGLIKAVSISPYLIFLDALILLVEQGHLIHYLSKNNDTERIPILVDGGFIRLHPGVMGLANENTVGVRPQCPNLLQEDLDNGFINQNPLIIGYPATNPELENALGNRNRHELLKSIVTKP
jgi:hypothetical protein